MKKVVSSFLVAGLTLTSINSLAFAKPSTIKSHPEPSKKIVEKISISRDNNTVNITKQVTETNTSKTTSKAPAKQEKKNVKQVKKIPPVIKLGKTVIPTTPLIKSTKADLQWDSASQTLTISKNNVVIKLVGNKVYVNGQEVSQTTIKKTRGGLLPFIVRTLNSKPQDSTTPPAGSTTTPTGTTTPTDTTTTTPVDTSTTTTSTDTTQTGSQTTVTSSDTQTNDQTTTTNSSTVTNDASASN